MTVFSVIVQLFLSPMKSNVAIQQWGMHHLITMQYILSWQEFKACIFQHSKPSGQEFYQIKQRMIDVSPCSELQEGMSHRVSLSWATKKGAVSKNTGLVCPNANTLTPSNGAFYMNWNEFDIQLPNSEHQMTVCFFSCEPKTFPEKFVQKQQHCNSVPTSMLCLSLLQQLDSALARYAIFCSKTRRSA